MLHSLQKAKCGIFTTHLLRDTLKDYCKERMMMKEYYRFGVIEITVQVVSGR